MTVHKITVARLKNLLGKLSSRQKQFMKTLSEPVLTTIEVQAGPPGLGISLEQMRNDDFQSDGAVDCRPDGAPRR